MKVLKKALKLDMKLKWNVYVFFSILFWLLSEFNKN